MSVRTFFMRTFFTGHVQGVGFRYQVVSIAKGFDLTGYVKNLSDGRVELLAEGDESEVLLFLEAIEGELDLHIKSVEKQTGSRIRRCSSFLISA